MPRKPSDYPAEFLAQFPEELQKLVLSDLTFFDFVRMADCRGREAIGQYGPSPHLVNAIDRLQESFMWAKCFNPATDSMQAQPPAGGGIIAATPEEADTLAKLDAELRKGKGRE